MAICDLCSLVACLLFTNCIPGRRDVKERGGRRRLGGRPRNNAVFCIYFRNAENEVKEKSDWERDLRMRGFPERER